MNAQNVKWELEMLLKARKELRLAGRDTDYSEDQRIKELREFLDKQDEVPAAPEAGRDDHAGAEF